MFTAGVSPAVQVCSSRLAKVSRSIFPSVVKGNKSAEIPSMRLRGWRGGGNTGVIFECMREHSCHQDRRAESQIISKDVLLKTGRVVLCEESFDMMESINDLLPSGRWSRCWPILTCLVAAFEVRGAQNVYLTGVPDYEWFEGCFGTS